MAVLSRVSVYEVRSILSSFAIPAELVLYIMDLAEYHPTLRAERSDNIALTARSERGGCWAAKLYLVSAPLPQRSPEDRFWQVRKVSWEVQGHDQGWASTERPGSYKPAWSWFDACIFRPLHTATGGVEPEGVTSDVTDIEHMHHSFRDAKVGMLEVQELLHSAGWSMVANGDGFVWRLQSNCVGEAEAERHVFEWSVDERGVDAEAQSHGSGDGDGFVEALRPGDRIGVWMQAKYPGWECYAEKASVEITYEFR